MELQANEKTILRLAAFQKLKKIAINLYMENNKVHSSELSTEELSDVSLKISEILDDYCKRIEHEKKILSYLTGD